MMEKFIIQSFNIIATDISSESNYFFQVDVELYEIALKYNLQVSLNIVSIDRMRMLLGGNNIYWDVRTIVCEDYIEATIRKFIEDKINQLISHNDFIENIYFAKAAKKNS